MNLESKSILVLHQIRTSVPLHVHMFDDCITFCCTNYYPTKHILCCYYLCSYLQIWSFSATVLSRCEEALMFTSSVREFGAEEFLNS